MKQQRLCFPRRYNSPGLATARDLIINGMHQSKNRRSRANAKRQYQDRGNRERRRLSQTSQRIARVLDQCFQKWQSFLGPIVFPDGFHSTELQYSLTPRFCGRQPGANIFGSLESEMFFDFRLQAIFVVLNLRPEDQPVEESPQDPHWKSSAFAAKNRPMMAAVCSQPRVSACNCLRPSRVR